jgi:hypothetical protein
MDILKITASELGYADCPRCLWMQARGVSFPSGFFNAAIREMEKEQRAIFTSRNLSVLCKDFPNGTVVKSKGRPETLPHKIGDTEIILSGQYDHLVALEDGDFALVAFKTSDPTKNIEKITVQLNALTYILARHKKVEEARRIVKAGVAVFDTNAFDKGEPFYKWYPVELDLATFQKNLEATLETIKDKCPPPDDCDWCKFQAQVNALKL